MSYKAIRSLNRLVDITNKELEEIRIGLNKIHNEIDAIQELITKLDHSLIEERIIAINNLEAAQSYTDFSLKAQMQREEYLMNINKLENKRELIQEKLRQKFIDVKTYEQLIKQKEAVIDLKEKREEQKSMDEMAIRLKKIYEEI